MNDLNRTKTYDFVCSGGSTLKVVISAEIKDLNKSDLQELLHEFANAHKSFYLGLGNEINNMP